MNNALLILSMFALLGASNEQAMAATAPVSAKATSAPEAPPTDSWVGKWVAVEGLYLTIRKDDAIGPGRYVLTMRYGLDEEDSGTFKGVATEEGISFVRPDGPKILRAGDGKSTGMKWLADKKNCLVVNRGEGYCRS